MGRIFGAIAIFCGWLSIPIGAMAALLTSEFFGLSHVEGPRPPMAVYGISGAVVLWVFVAAAMVTAVPLASAIVATNPRRPLNLMAVALAIAGVALIPDQLGRSFGLPLLAGAGCLWLGGVFMNREALAQGSVGAPSPALGPALDAGVAATGSVPEPAIPDAADAAKAGSPATSSDPTLSSTVAAPPQQAPKPTGGRGRRSSRGRPRMPGQVCSWCSTEVLANSGVCPNCGATLDEQAANQIQIPGLTEVPPDLRRYAEDARRGQGRTSLLKMMLSGPSIPTATNVPPPSDAAALRPPSPELKAEMARLDADIAAGVVPLGADSGELRESKEGAEGAESAEPPQPPAAP